jgi:hypothetical protein
MARPWSALFVLYNTTARGRCYERGLISPDGFLQPLSLQALLADKRSRRSTSRAYNPSGLSAFCAQPPHLCAAWQQLVQRSAVHDPPFLQHQDLVRALQHGTTV